MAINLAIISSGFLAIAVGTFVWTLLNQNRQTPDAENILPHLEVERLNKLRLRSNTFRRFEPLVTEVAAIDASLIDKRVQDELALSMSLLPSQLPWRTNEYIACKQLEAIVVGAVVGGICMIKMGALGCAIAAFLSGGAYFYIFINDIRQEAQKRIHMMKRRLPFAVDLMALMLESGASFSESLQTAMRENAGHPLGEELATIVSQIEMGRPRSQALNGLRIRFNDEVVSELISAINTGEELGTPLSAIMRNQADQMRLKRSQWGEKAAAEAQVQMTFPSMLIMVACMLVILAPFLLEPLLKML